MDQKAKPKCNETCCHLMWRASGFRVYEQRCQSKCKVERNGRHYCNRHDPVKVKVKEAARRLAWDAQYDERTKSERAEKAEAESVGTWLRYYQPAQYRDVLNAIAEKMNELSG